MSWVIESRAKTQSVYTIRGYYTSKQVALNRMKEKQAVNIKSTRYRIRKYGVELFRCDACFRQVPLNQMTAIGICKHCYKATRNLIDEKYAEVIQQ